MTITSAALDGIHRAEARLEQTAVRLAKQTDSSSQGPDVVSLSDEVVGLIQARIEVATSVKAIHAYDEVQRALLDLLA
jgi:hypothetical protein